MQQQTSWLKDLLFLAFVLGGLFFILLGARPLFVPDEGRYAEIAREMVASGDYLTPYLNGIKYFEKPVLFYWLEAAAIHIGGLNLWSVRSVNALLALLGCLVTYCTARTIYDRRTGLLAAFILGTSTLYFVMAHMISLDLPVTIFIAITLYAVLLGTRSPEPRRIYFWIAAVAAAAAVLTKGLIGIVFPATIIAAYLAFTGEWRLLLRMYIPSCILIFLLVAAPWHILVAQKHPEFFHFYFIKQHFLRYTTLKIGHYQPAYYFIPVLIAGFFPWIVFLPQTINRTVRSIWQDKIKNKPDLFFFLWAAIIFIFFSISKSKLIPYILPVFPPLSILTARYLQQSIMNKTFKGSKAGLFILLLISITLAVFIMIVFPKRIVLPDPKTATQLLMLAAGILVIGSAVAFFYRQQLLKSIVIVIITSCLFLITAFAAMPYIDARTILPLANKLNSILTPHDEVITYNQYFQDLPFYLQRRVSILNWKNELTFGIQHQKEHDWMINDETFWQLWRSDKRVFLVISKEEYGNLTTHHPKEHKYLLEETPNNVLISNQKIPK